LPNQFYKSRSSPTNVSFKVPNLFNPVSTTYLLVSEDSTT